MLSSNNRDEYLRKQEPKKQRFAIKKLTVGVASVLIGFTFMGMNVAAHADSNTTTEPTQTETDPNGTSKPKADVQVTNNGDESQVKITGNQTEQPAGSGENSNGSTNTFTPSSTNPVTPTEVEQEAPVEAPTEVSDWQGFVNALADGNVHNIQLTKDITVGPATGLTASGAFHKPAYAGLLEFNANNVARNLTIDGQGHTINFGQYYLEFEDSNYGSQNSAWDLIFKDLVINADEVKGLQAKGSASPFFFGAISASNSKNTTVTLDGVSGTVTGRSFLSGSFSNHGSNYLTVNLAGKNNINAYNVMNGTAGANDTGSAIDAGNVTVEAGSDTVINASTANNGNKGYQTIGGSAVRVANGDVNVLGNLTINAKDAEGQSSENLSGIWVNNGLTGTVNVSGHLTENMGAGRSTAIFAGNLNINQGAVVDITTQQDNNQNTTAGNAVEDLNGFHYGVIALGVGNPQNYTNADSNTLTDNGSLTIKRTSSTPTQSQLISFGSGSGAVLKGTFTLNVGNGATLDLQDASTALKGSNNKPWGGLISMYGDGAASNDTITFDQPAYVNLQRTGSSYGNLIRMEGHTNKVTITGTPTTGTPVAQWDQANMTDYPSFDWYITNESNHNNSGDHAITGFGTAATPENKDGKDAFINSVGSTVDFGTKTSSPVSQNAFQNHFSWWNPQRITIGTKAANDPAYTEADRYVPEYSAVNIKTTDQTGKTSTISYTNLNGSNVTTNPAANYVVDSSNLPSGMTATVANDGTVTVKTNNTPAGSYDIPVTITYTGDQSSEKANVHVIVTNDQTSSTTTEADLYDPKGQNVTTTVNVTPDAKEGIKNAGSLPNDATYEWATTPDVSKAGVVPAIVNVNYGDGSQDQVPVNVIVNDTDNNVPDTTGDAEANNPQGKDVTTTIGKLPDASEGVQWPNGTAPAGVTYTWSTTPDVYTKGAHPGVVQVTYPDGTVDYVPTTVIVKNSPTGKNTHVTTGTTHNNLPDPSTVIDWTNGGQNPDGTAPSGATYEWTTDPDTTQVGPTTGVVTITYPNGEKVPVTVPVTVTSTTTDTAPYADPINYKYNQTVPTDSATVGSYVTWPSGTAPADVTYTWKPGTEPDTTKANTTQNSTIVATYTDPSDHTQTIIKNIPVIVHVGSMADYYTPTATDLTVPHNADMSKYPASAQISGVPANVVSYDAWAPMPVTEVSGTQPTMIKVTYTDGSFDYVPLNVHVYAPEYAETSVAQGGTQTVTPTWTADKGTQNVSFARTTDTPAWATVDPDGTVHLNPGTDVNAGDYAIPVQVSYNNNTNETVYVPVVVTGTNHSDTGDIVYGQNTSTSYTLGTFDTHKTNDGSASATVTAPQVQKITFANQSYNKKTHQYKVETSVTYELQGNQYVATAVTVGGVTYTGADVAAHLAEVDVHSGTAKASFDASAIKTVWLKASDADAAGVDRTPNTDASNFANKGDGTNGSGTKTSTAESQYGDPEGDQRTTTGDNLPGNSKARVSITLSGDALTAFGHQPGWCNAFGNFYGAETNSPLTFKQNQDISNLTQAQYRDLINVTDLGKTMDNGENGWNGVNVNPDAPMVLAYIPGTDNAKTFWMSWAPNGQPSTATIANGVSGTVRIYFNDGTWLDIPATINVVADPDAGKPDQDKTEFTQKIVYTYNGNEVATTNIDNIAKGTDVSAATLKSTIDANVPNNYSIAAGYTYPAGLTNVTATPATIYVPLTLNSGETFSDTGKIVYQTADGHHVADGKTIKSNNGDILTAALLKDLADQKVPAGYHIVQYPGSYTVTGDGFTIPVIIEKDNDNGGNPDNTKPDDHTPGDNGNHNPGNNNNNGNGNNGNGNGGNLNTNNGDNGNNANNNNGAKKALPQTGNTNSAAAVAGLGLAGLTAMLGLAGTKKRKND